MVKGFIFFRDGKIPFVIENYRMELFTDDSLLDDFCKEYNFKENYILHGQCFDIGIRGRKATFLVENSMGSTCYLRCYTINMFDKDEEYDSIGLQSPSLDEVFRYEYEYIDMVRAGINLAIEPKVVYKVPFGMNDQKYELCLMNSLNYYHERRFLQRWLVIKLRKLGVLLPMDMRITMISKMTPTPNV